MFTLPTAAVVKGKYCGNSGIATETPAWHLRCWQNKWIWEKKKSWGLPLLLHTPLLWQVINRLRETLSMPKGLLAEIAHMSNQSWYNPQNKAGVDKKSSGFLLLSEAWLSWLTFYMRTPQTTTRMYANWPTLVTACFFCALREQN